MALGRHGREGGNTTPWRVFAWRKSRSVDGGLLYIASIYARSNLGSQTYDPKKETKRRSTLINSCRRKMEK